MASEEYKNPLDPFNAAADRVVAATKEETPAPEAQEEEVVEEVAEEIVKEEVAEESPEVAEEATSESESQTEEDTTVEEETSNEDVQQEDDVISDWDITSEEAESAAEFDYTSLATEAGFEAKNKDEFIKMVSEYKAKAESPDPTSTLPENLKEAIKIAGEDGNYLEYLGVTSVDYDAYNSLALVKGHYEQIFTNVNGVVDTDMLEMKMDGMSDADIEIEGQTLRSQYKGMQTQKADAIKAEANRNRELADKALRKVLDDTKEIDGFKLSPTNKKQLYDDITSGDMIAEMFHGTDGKIDQLKVLTAYSRHKFGDKQRAYLRQKISTEATKKVLDKIGNKNINTKAGGLPNVTPEKAKTGQQALAAELKEHGAKLFNPMR